MGKLHASPYELKNHCAMCGKGFTKARTRVSSGVLLYLHNGMRHREACHFCGRCAGTPPIGATPKRRPAR
jgi:hypothetical protein